MCLLFLLSASILFKDIDVCFDLIQILMVFHVRTLEMEMRHEQGTGKELQMQSQYEQKYPSCAKPCKYIWSGFEPKQ